MLSIFNIVAESMRIRNRKDIQKTKIQILKKKNKMSVMRNTLDRINSR